MQTNDKLKIALLGIGQHAQKNLIPAILNSSATQLIGLCSRNIKKAADLSETLHCRSWPSYSQLLADEQVSTVYLATPIATHYQFALAALKAGKHVLCEKSITNNLNHTNQLIALAESRSLILTETFMYQFHPQFIQLKEALTNQNFGDIKTLIAHFTIPYLSNPGYRLSSEMGGGALWDIGCYPISLLNMFNLQNAQLLNIDIYKHPTHEVDWAGTAYLRLNAHAHAFFTWGYDQIYKNHCTIHGTKQSITLNKVFAKVTDAPSTLLLYDQHDQLTKQTVKAQCSFACMFDYCRSALTNNILRTSLYQQIYGQAELMNQFSLKTHQPEPNEACI